MSDIWEALAEVNQRINDGFRLLLAAVELLKDRMDKFTATIQLLKDRMEKLEALQWTDEEVDKLVGSGLLGHEPQ